MPALKGLNLACGPVYIASESWINVDYHSVGPAVIACDLLKDLPFPPASFDLLYSSHFLEHLPRDVVLSFLYECRRVLKPGGVIRLVLPDCEELFSQFLSFRSRNLHAEADFLLVTIIDQCVRQRAGGQLGDFYSRIDAMDPASRSYWTDFVADYTGEFLDDQQSPGVLGAHSSRSRSLLPAALAGAFSRRSPQDLLRRIRFKIHQLGLSLLLPEFRRQNVSFTPIGERHCWLWDFHQLAAVLRSAGFVSVVRQSHLSSMVDHFPFYPLDATMNGMPRMGRQSMYVEACVPDR
jgi:SAM-dependent methyltransferase